MIGIGAGGASATEVVLSLVFVLVVLIATSRVGSPGFAGLAIGQALTAVHLNGIPLDGTSVNPVRSLRPAIIHAGTALSQVWLFIIAPCSAGRSRRCSTATSSRPSPPARQPRSPTARSSAPPPPHEVRAGSALSSESRG